MSHVFQPLKISVFTVSMAIGILFFASSVQAENALPCPDKNPTTTSGYYKLAESYFSGVCTDVNYAKAEKWYLKAAEQDDGLSQLRLGLLYAENHFTGVKTDYAEAEKWFTKAAEQDAGDARFRLGNFYAHYMKPPAYDKAFHWLKRAAEGGHTTAQYDLANLYKNGHGTDANEDEFIYWMETAGDNGSKNAQMTLSRFYEQEKDDPENGQYWAEQVTKHKTAEPYWLNKVADYYMEKWNIALARPLYERALEKDSDNTHAAEALERIFSIIPDSRGKK